MYKSSLINLNVLNACHHSKVKKIFFSSTACIYPFFNQNDVNNPICNEASAYPASPDSEYGWEKLYAERLYLCFKKNYGLDVKIGRFHNVYGPFGTWEGGREKAPAAFARKFIEAQFLNKNNEIEVWGDGTQLRSFTYIDDCIEGSLRLFNSKYFKPINIGSSNFVSINQLVKIFEALILRESKLKNLHNAVLKGAEEIKKSKEEESDSENEVRNEEIRRKRDRIIQSKIKDLD
jgi:nucleoside-diphosphate-sugar epimerase